MGYDLVLENDPASPSSLEQISSILKIVESTPSMTDCEIVAAATEPSAADAVALQECFKSGELSRPDFDDFCCRHQLVADPRDTTSASAFLRSRWGAQIVTVTLPHDADDVEQVFEDLVLIARNHGLRLTDPQMGIEIDLDSPGVLPPMW